jgi:Ca2+-dependent lipid-binding protein
MGDPDYPREQWITQGKAKEDDVPKAQMQQEKAEKEEKKKALEADSDQDGVADDDESGDFLCYEISFSYSAEPGQKAKNDYIHLMLTFFLGNDLLRLPINVWAQVQKISGTVRLRAQMVESPPYIRNLTISLMGVPNIEVGVIPMTRLLPNVLDLPIVSGFVKSSIAAACNEYVAPKSMTLNMAQMLSGDGVKKDTDAVGVLCIQLLRGEDLSAQDNNGQSDPYVVVSFAKFGRPLYSTRIIFEDLNPNWNETANLLVTKEDIRADETLSIQRR